MSIIIIVILVIALLSVSGYLIYDKYNKTAECPKCEICKTTECPTYKIPITSKITDWGYQDGEVGKPLKKGWYDAQQQGYPADYCRYVGSRENPEWSCALAGSTDQYKTYDPTLQNFQDGPKWL